MKKIKSLMIEYINWDPIYKFHLWGKVYIYIYSIMFVFSFIVGWYIMYYIFYTEKINKKYLDSLLKYTFFGTLIGARLGQILFYDFSYFSDHWIEAFLPIKENLNHTFFFIKGYEFIGYRGLSSHGATIGILISSFFYNKKVFFQKSFIWLCDRLCIISSISAAFIRIGNFFNSEVVGVPSNLPWAVKFLKMDTSYGEIVPRHPTQIYESIGYFIIFIILFIIYMKNFKNKNYKDGFILGIFFTSIWIFRFFIEFFKEPQNDEFINFFILNTGQCLSIPFIFLGIFLLVKNCKKWTNL